MSPIGTRCVEALLDTHTWLWSELEPARLPRWAARALRSTAHELWLSPLNVWELALLAEKDKIELDRPWQVWAQACLERSGYRSAPVTEGVVLAASAVRLAHRDPIDRRLAATARCYELTRISHHRARQRQRKLARALSGDGICVGCGTNTAWHRPEAGVRAPLALSRPEARPTERGRPAGVMLVRNAG